MKLADLSEARLIDASQPKLKLVHDVFSEAGIKPIRLRGAILSDAILAQAVGMIKDAMKKEEMSDPFIALPFALEFLEIHLNKIGINSLNNVVNGLQKLQGIGHLMHDDMNIQLQRTCVQLIIKAEELPKMLVSLRAAVSLIKQLWNLSKNSKDEYHASIARAVLKQLGVINKDEK